MGRSITRSSSESSAGSSSRDSRAVHASVVALPGCVQVLANVTVYHRPPPSAAGGGGEAEAETAADAGHEARHGPNIPATAAGAAAAISAAVAAVDGGGGGGGVDSSAPLIEGVAGGLNAQVFMEAFAARLQALMQEDPELMTFSTSAPAASVPHPEQQQQEEGQQQGWGQQQQQQQVLGLEAAPQVMYVQVGGMQFQVQLSGASPTAFQTPDAAQEATTAAPATTIAAATAAEQGLQPTVAVAPAAAAAGLPPSAGRGPAGGPATFAEGADGGMRVDPPVAVPTFGGSGLPWEQRQLSEQVSKGPASFFVREDAWVWPVCLPMCLSQEGACGVDQGSIASMAQPHGVAGRVTEGMVTAAAAAGGGGGGGAAAGGNVVGAAAAAGGVGRSSGPVGAAASGVSRAESDGGPVMWTYRVDIHGVVGPWLQVVVFNDKGVVVNKEVPVVNGEAR